MAYYDALIAKWAQAPAGTTQQKLAWINAQTVVGDPIKMMIPPWEIYNRVDRVEYEALVASKEAPLQRNLALIEIDFSPNSGARNLFAATFASTSKTWTAIKAYCDTFDTPKIPWPTAPIAKGGGGLTSPVSINDLTAAGIV